MTRSSLWRAGLVAGWVLSAAAGVWAQNTPTPTLTPWPAACSVETSWGGSGSGDGVFNQMRGIAIHGETLYAVDMANNRIQRFTLMGAPILPALTGSGQLNQPFGIAVDAAGLLYVSENQSSPTTVASIVQIDPALDSAPATVFSGLTTFGGVGVDSDGDVYASVMSDSSVEGARKFRQVVPGNWVQASSLVGSVNLVNGVLPLSNGVTVYILDTGNHRIQEFVETPPGSNNYVFARVVVTSTLNNPPGYTVWPHQLIADPAGFFYLTDLGNRFQVFDLNWNFRYFCSFNGSFGVALDGSGFIYGGSKDDGTINRFRSTRMPLPATSPTPLPPDCGSQLQPPFVFPSPMRPGPGKLSVQLCRRDLVKIHVYNAGGSLASKMEFTGLAGDNVKPWDFSNYAPGVYYFLVEVGGQRQPLRKFAIIE